MGAGEGEGGATSFPCARCGAMLRAPRGRGGKRGRCRHCGTVQIIPEAGAFGYALVEAPLVAPPSPPLITPGSSRERRPRARWSWPAWLQASARDQSVLESEIVALVLLSLADLMVTYHLLNRGPSFYESNPVAQYFFARWNIAGMAIFKFSVVGFVVVVGEAAERARPGLGRLVVLIGCLASAVVVCYGLRLAFGGVGG